jgi:hydrogenase maturation protease
VAALSRLRARYDGGDRVQMLDGGTLGLSLLPYLQDATDVVLVDAVCADAPAGSLVRLTGDEVGTAVAHRLSVHQVGVADLLDGARLSGRLPQRLTLLGVVPESMELDVGLSPAVAASIDELVSLVAREIVELGFALRRRTTDAPHVSLDGDDHAHRVLGLHGG